MPQETREPIDIFFPKATYGCLPLIHRECLQKQCLIPTAMRPGTPRVKINRG